MDVEAFIKRWSHLEGGAERANYASFLIELCDVLGVPRPDPAGASSERNDYVFERAVKRTDGSTGRIDLYRRDAFVLEAKQSRQADAKGWRGDKFIDTTPEQASLDLPHAPQPLGRRSARRGWDVLMLNARRQAEDYARDLPQTHGWPPFVLVCDVGQAIEVYADFRRMGKYEQFPDRLGFRIYLEDLRDEKVRERLRQIWLDPHSLDPTRRTAKATREIAVRLAAVSKSLEKTHDPEEVAHFLMRCLFTMFAEDVDLLPEASFQGLLADCVTSPDSFAPLLTDLWAKMDTGGFAASIRAAVKRFNGALFKDAHVIAMGCEEIGELLAAAKADWKEVEPAIFGALLEQALSPTERKKLGAHYTPRAYVERLVTATILDPLRADWRTAVAAMEAKLAEGDRDGAIEVVEAFHKQLCDTRVLDPACGTGNFLYVSLDLMKRLEGEVLQTLSDLGGQDRLGLKGYTVDPHQFLGLELNPRAAAIAELVIWIGYLQLHFKTRGEAPGEPILQAFGNINFGKPGGYDAVLTWDGYPLPKVVREDGGAREVYPRARQPKWPEAEFIVGNPPFIGGKDLRSRMGDGYVEALWASHKAINPSADFVMYWWDRAAELLTVKGTKLQRFGFVTTNSITQEFSRRVMKKRMNAKTPISLIYAVPDHPWIKTARDTAAVRIAMTVAAKGRSNGLLREVVDEGGLNTDEPRIDFFDRRGAINADITVGADPSSTVPLIANSQLCINGMKPLGRGFIISHADAITLGLSTRPGANRHIVPYRNGRDLAALPRGVYAIDFTGLTSEQARHAYPEAYQHLLSTVKPEREEAASNSKTKDAQDYAARWWLFCRSRPELRAFSKRLSRVAVTVQTARHRVFQFLDVSIMPDQKLMVFGLDDGLHLAILSSSVHVVWTIRTCGWLGIGNDSVYVKSKTFDPFPFPDPDAALKARLREAGERLDAFRKARQAEHPRLTLTQMYNVREAIRAGRALTPDEARIKDEGLVLILNELHDEIDALTLQAYGWPDGLSDEEIVARLVALNAERAAEERRGEVRWLRPDYQKARAGVIAIGGEQIEAELGLPLDAALQPFPRNPFEQAALVGAALAQAGGPADAAQIAARWKPDKRTTRKIETILAAFVRTGEAATPDAGQTFTARRAA